MTVDSRESIWIIRTKSHKLVRNYGETLCNDNDKNEKKNPLKTIDYVVAVVVDNSFIQSVGYVRLHLLVDVEVLKRET